MSETLDFKEHAIETDGLLIKFGLLLVGESFKLDLMSSEETIVNFLVAVSFLLLTGKNKLVVGKLGAMLSETDRVRTEETIVSVWARADVLLGYDSTNWVVLFIRAVLLLSTELT